MSKQEKERNGWRERWIKVERKKRKRRTKRERKRETGLLAHTKVEAQGVKLRRRAIMT